MYMPDIGRWGVVDPLTEQTPSWSPYAYGFNNTVRFVDPTGMSNEDFIDINKKTGAITITKADGNDQIRLIGDNGKVEKKYTYGENGRFTKENKIIEGDFKNSEGKVMKGTAVISENTKKLDQFFKFASNSNVEFSFKEVQNSESKKDVGFVATSHQKSTECFGNMITYNLLINSEYSHLNITKEVHSHPGGTPHPSLSDKNSVKWNKTYFPNRTPSYKHIYLPHKNKEIKFDDEK